MPKDQLFLKIAIIGLIIFSSSVNPGPCASDPCAAGATCVDYGVNDLGEQTYTCLCPDNRDGNDCGTVLPGE